MTVWAHWRGLIARTGVDTTDGRRLELGDFAAAHFIRLPVPVTALPKPGEPGERAPWGVVGRVDRVSIRTPEVFHQQGKEIQAEGVINLSDLSRVRPDLEPPTRAGPESPPFELWPVGITVVGGEFGGEPVPEGHPMPEGVPIVMQGPWELTGLAIEHEPSVWPGVGIEIHQFEDDGRIES